MRLLNTSTLKVELFQDDEIRPYAILSHRWQSEEVTFEDIEKGHAKSKKGYEKVKRCCSVAKENGFEYAWIDTLCIDKTSSAELSEAINSMYQWYQQAEICYTYLADVSHPSEFFESEWFRRGWTLQELIAPPVVQFFDKNWQELGTKDSLAQALSDRTAISRDILLGKDDLDTASVAQRMSWAADRETTRIEDRAYSLMGIFGINMPLLYGEGNRAFVRLQEEILKISDDHSIFAWRSTQEIHGGILAASPNAFKDSADIVSQDTSKSISGPVTISNKGIHLEVRFIGVCSPGIGLAILECSRDKDSDASVVIYLRDLYLTMEYFERVECGMLGQLSRKDLKLSQYPIRKICIRHRHLAPTRKAKVTHSSNTLHESQKIPDEAVSPFMNKLKSLSVDQQKAELAILFNSLRSLEPSRVKNDGAMPLMEAAAKGDRDTVWLLLTRSDVHLNQADSMGRTALWHAAGAGDESTVKVLLIQSGIRIDSKDNSYITPLSRAIVKGHEPVARLLLETAAIDLESSDKNGHTPLSLSVLYEREKIFRLLLENGADLETRNEDGQTPLMIATERGSNLMFELVLASGANLEAKSRNGQTALSVATRKGHETIIKRLLDSGANTESSDENDLTPLAHAAEDGFDFVLNLLLKGGANIESKNKHGQTPLFHASKKGHEPIVRSLLNNGADLSSQDRFGKTPLLWAVWKGHEKVVRLLIDNGADLQMRDNYKQDALSIAINGSTESIVRLLLEGGADPNLTDEEGKSPLQCAILKGKDEYVQLLLDKGADTELGDTGYGTPLMLAAKWSKVSVAKALLNKGAATEVSDNSAESPLLYAAIAGNVPIARFLLEKGANPHYQGRGTRTPLWWAVIHGDETFARLLLEHGLDQSEKNAMLVEAKYRQQNDLARLLTSYGANTDPIPEKSRVFILGDR